ncbi:XRE family transcriptional regulator [Mesorhizobium sp. Root172]|uniref:XRE family transcriptional regulator n=1 Tax=Mesorhizobium sp. Root172 TaxID=1736481 RepID=UPI001FCDBF25|nr:XRE family transcriptional regulator [Mesorhizobium sp. Root172]
MDEAAHPECPGFQQAVISGPKTVAGDFMMITGAQCRAARALVEWTRDKLAGNSGVDALVIEEFERRINLPDQDICDTLQTALESAGAVFIAENGGGVGVRLKLNRSEVRRIGVLENEGGIVGTDAVP